MTDTPLDAAELATLREIESRVLWLATRIVDSANHDRVSTDGVKVGGHQSSSASMVSIMTALWFAHLHRDDRVSVKPHASPVLHAINYLLGALPREQLTRLRDFGGLQAYPSRTKDPDPVDFSTGSVGLGATAPLFAAATRRYVDAHFGDRPPTRFVALIGDAELDEGNIWEALLDPALSGLGNVLWVVDLNRQSLDRVVPGMKVQALASAFVDAGWHVATAKYGSTLRGLFAQPGGEDLRDWIDLMPNHEYQALFGRSGADLRALVGKQGGAVESLLADVPDDALLTVLGDLGGHDLGALVEAYRSADAVTDRPSVVFAYTVKGYRLPTAGDPANHSALLTGEQLTALRRALGRTVADEWDRCDPASAAGELCRRTATRLHREVTPRTPTGVEIPDGTLGPPRPGQLLSTQDAFGRALTALARTPAADRVVTLSPDVSVSTNLGGWINKVGVFAPDELPDPAAEGRALRWHQSPAGQHIELGISEMNFFSLITQLGLADEFSGQTLLPIGTVYDPFVCRGLDAFVYGAYNRAKFVVAGTPSGVSLAAEGGAHQSAITASIGLELPNVVFAEPAYAAATDWLLCAALQAIADGRSDAESLYLRLSTRPLDQAPFAAAQDRLGADALRAAVLAGGYRLQEPAGPAAVQLVGSGAVLDGLLAAADELAAEGLHACVVDVTSLDLLYRGWAAARRAPLGDLRRAAPTCHVATVLAPGVPIVTVHDAASHAMAWLGSVHGSRVVPLGVDAFGQSGSVADLHRHFEIDAAAIVNAALVAVNS